jgi:hypothetical protein
MTSNIKWPKYTLKSKDGNLIHLQDSPKGGSVFLDLLSEGHLGLT